MNSTVNPAAVGAKDARRVVARAALFAAAMFLLWAPGLEAQRERGTPQHDVTGPLTTGSDIAGGILAPARMSRALKVAAEAVALRAANRELTGPDGVVIAPEAQALALAAMNGDEGALAALAAALGGAEALPVMAIAVEGGALAGLIEGLDGLLAQPEPRQFARAVDAFDGFLEQASPAFLADPPPAFLAVWATLAAMVAGVGG